MTSSTRRSAVPRAARFERPRTHLLTRLSESIDSPLVVLAAPSGYGKTTLLAQYARVTPRRVAWCRLTDAQEGPAIMTARLAQSLNLTALSTPDPRTPAGALLDLLASALSQLPEGVDLIVDNAEGEGQREWLARLADTLEEGHRLLVSSYTTDGFRIARRLADGQAIVLDATDLSFTDQEVAAYLQERSAPVAPADVNHLSGWPAGLALASHGAPRHASADDLVLEALGTLPPGVRSALHLLAPLDVWTESDALTLAPELPAGWLQAVQRAGLPVIPLGGGAVQPHRLLVSVLGAQLARQPARAAEARQAAALIAQARGETERAAWLYLQGENPAAALEVATPLVALYRDRGEHHRTRALLEAFDAALLSVPLLERLAWAQVETGAASQGEAVLEDLQRRKVLSPSGLASLAMIRGRQGHTDAQYALALEGLNRGGPVIPALYWPFVQAALRLGRLAEAEAATERLRHWAQSGTDPVRQAEAWHLQAITWQRTRTPDEAVRALTRARAAYEQLGWQGRAAGLHLDELELTVRAGAATEVLCVTLRALDTRLSPEASVLQVRRLRLLGTVQRRLGHLSDAEESLTQALQVANDAGIHPGSAGLTLALADVLVASGRLSEAREWLSAETPRQPGILRSLLHAQVDRQPLHLTPDDLNAETDQEIYGRALAFLASAGTPATRPPQSAAAYTLRIFTLGDCRAAIEGQPVKLGLAKARELLVWLSLHTSGSRDELVTALWDGSDEERHVEYFRVTVRRLRAALRTHLPDGLDPLPYADGRYRLSESLTVEVDVQDPVTPAALRPFLPGVDTEWVTTYRQLHAQQAAGTLLSQAAALPLTQAAAAYAALVRLDPLLAGAHEGLITSLHALGDPGLQGALQQYERVLSDEYGERLPTHLRNLCAG